MNAPKFQAALIEAIKKRLPSDLKLAGILSSDLHITQSSAYKRIRGDIPFSLHEVIELCYKYKLSLDAILSPFPNKFESSFSGIQARSSAREYLDLLESEVTTAARTKGTKAWYVTNGLPDLYLFYFEGLTLFQYYTWEKMVWGNADWEDKKFSLDMPDKTALLQQAKRIAHTFNQVDLQEIWNENILDSFFRQFLYVVESRLFESNTDMRMVFEQMWALIDHLQSICVAGKRFVPGESAGKRAAPSRHYYNETMQNSIFILKKGQAREELYIVFDRPNYIKSDDPHLIAHSRSVLEKLRRRSLPLNGENEKTLNVFFGKLQYRWHYYQRVMENTLGRTTQHPF